MVRLATQDEISLQYHQIHIENTVSISERDENGIFSLMAEKRQFEVVCGRPVK